MFVRAEHLRSQLLQSVRAGDEPLLPGTRFELLKVLRQDRHGVVYRAYDTDEDCLSDLRLVETRYPEDASQNLRAVAARLQRVVGEGFARFDVESSDAGPCLVSSASDAPTLRTWLGDPRARTWSFVSTLAIYVATSLAELHRHGAVHGDVRPDAILFARNENDAEISLVDVALSAVLDGVVPEYARELPPGDAYAYAPPERMAGLRDDAQADQYAFCATLWELVYGCPPWADVQPYTREWMLARLECPPRAEPVSWVPAGFDAVLRRGLSPGPRDRYRDMIALRDALEALQYVTPEEAHAAHAALDRVASECMERLARLAPLDRATLIDKAVHDLLSLGYDELDAFERIDADGAFDFDALEEVARASCERCVDAVRARVASLAQEDGDVARVDHAFARLAERGILARHTFGETTRDGLDTMLGELVPEQRARGRDVRGYTFATIQAVEGAIDHGSLELLFGAVNGDPSTALVIARDIVDELARAGLTVHWDGTRAGSIYVDVLWARRPE